MNRDDCVLGEFSVAPMLDVTDRHCRVFLRLLSRRVKLYTEMKVSAAVVHGDRERLLGFDPSERPLAIQLAGSEPDELAACARLAAAVGYDEVNLNVGCPSARVRDGQFGACLMAQPARVARCVAAMRAAVAIPVTVKTRIGIDHHDSYEYLAEFVGSVARGGCEHFIVHARKAWLSGLSPKANRVVPVLRYDRVYRLKRDFPHLRFTLNGGVTSVEDALAHLRRVDGVMVGREACRNPWMLSAVDRVLFGEPPAVRTRREVVAGYVPYVVRQLACGVPLRRLLRPLLGLYHGQPRARAWRRQLCAPGVDGVDVIWRALALVDGAGADDAAGAGEHHATADLRMLAGNLNRREYAALGAVE